MKIRQPHPAWEVEAGQRRAACYDANFLRRGIKGP